MNDVRSGDSAVPDTPPEPGDAANLSEAGLEFDDELQDAEVEADDQLRQ